MGSMEVCGSERACGFKQCKNKEKKGWNNTSQSIRGGVTSQESREPKSVHDQPHNDKCELFCESKIALLLLLGQLALGLLGLQFLAAVLFALDCALAGGDDVLELVVVILLCSVRGLGRLV